MATTFRTPVQADSPLAGPAPEVSDVEQIRALESRLEQHSNRRDGWTMMIFGVAIVALMFSVIAAGFGLRAIGESKRHVQAAATAAVPAAAPAPAGLSSVTLGDMTVTPSSAIVHSGKYTVTITNAGKMVHELLVFHTEIVAANLPVGPDGKVAEDAPGFMVSDGDNLDPGASQSRVIDLTQPGTYLFVCNLPGHLMAGMHSTVTVS